MRTKYYFTFDIKKLIGAAQDSLPILDSCSNSPCYDNVTCYLDINSVDGFACGECPLGTTGDGQSCIDLDEVLLFYFKCKIILTFWQQDDIRELSMHCDLIIVVSQISATKQPYVLKKLTAWVTVKTSCIASTSDVRVSKKPSLTKFSTTFHSIII